MGLGALALADVVHDDAKDVGMTYWQHEWDKKTEQRQLENQKELNQQGAGLASLARQNSAYDMVVGMRRAGLNPALASGSQFGTAGSGGTASAQNSGSYSGSHSQMGALALEAVKYQQSERKLIDAQTADLNASAHGKQIDNANKDAENAAIGQLLADELKIVSAKYGPDSPMGRWASALNASGAANAGTLNAVRNVISAESATSDWSIKKQADTLLRHVTYEQAKDTELASLLANVPRYEAQRLFDLTEQIARQNVILSLQGDLLNFDKEHLNERYEKEMSILNQQIDQLETMIKNTKDHNLIDAWEKGDYMKFAIGAFVLLLPQLLGGGANIATTQMLINARRNQPSTLHP